MAIADRPNIPSTKPEGSQMRRIQLSALLAAASLPSAALAGRLTVSDVGVADAQSKLMWELHTALPQPVSHEKAAARCKSLATGGFGDWRLPTVNEIIGDKRKSTPPMDPTAFNATPSGQYWTSSIQGSGASAAAFAAEFLPGRRVAPLGRDETARVVCVRPLSEPEAKPSAATAKTWVVADMTVLSPTTHLTWQRGVGTTGNAGALYAQPEAVAYCDNLALGGNDDWRLPSAVELRTLIDPVKREQAHGRPLPNGRTTLDEDVFTDTKWSFWTTTRPGCSGDNTSNAAHCYSKESEAYALVVDFRTGEVRSKSVARQELNQVRCVRGTIPKK